MPKLVVKAATLRCSMGTGPSTFEVVPHSENNGAKQPLATIQDFKPNVNIKPFALCKSPSNPQVAAAKAPQPCVPVVAAAWSPGSASIVIDGQPALTDDSKCTCQWGGVIEIVVAGQPSVEAG